eukprot:CAMPEP_0181104500 /NCGR_PEP_ID=MMETSP1071-20121207/15467_1 /TAXON_ID=35127 /ORGANISM="Thalassiosira sp., Strain NH16" /LENGTH=303 /DNA_ID=CAMNT_0023187715 /DNA_START=62 /DNA_END=970 /DNA_ORIENTATION=+
MPRDDHEHVDDDDDEEIDEDEAFNSEDELTYGNFFSSSKKKKPAKSSNGDAADDDDESGESSDDSGDDGENDWAGSDDDSEGEDDDGGQYMLDLLDNLDRQVPPSSASGKKRAEKGEGGGRISLNCPASEAAVHLPESEFQSGALSAMSADAGGGGGGGALTLDSLMGGIADTAGFASVQKTMRALSSSGPDNGGKKGAGSSSSSSSPAKLETTAAPVPRVVSERASRRVHYESSSRDASRWTDAVHEQRDAETLDFRTNRGGATTHRVTRDGLVDKFEAATDFEREMADALEKAGMEDEGAM